MSEDDLIIGDDEPAAADDEPKTPARRGKSPVVYSLPVAEAILVAIAEGKTLSQIAKQPEMPARNTIYRWLTQYPKFYDAYERAKEVSAQSLEDEALTIARNLSGTNDYTGTKVTALNYAMQQLRWSAARRDPARYGQSNNGNTSVPITINSTLNLGGEGQPTPQDNAQSIYSVSVVVDARPAADNSPDTDDDAVDLEAVVDDNGQTVFGVPTDEKPDLREPKKRGRPVGAKQGPRKSERRAKATATRYANKAKKEQ